MTLVILLLCAATVVLVGVALFGPRRWHRHVTRKVRPGTPEPTASGYALLSTRNGVLAVVATAIMVPVSLDHFQVSQEELGDATVLGVARIDDQPLITESRIQAEVEPLLGHDVAVDYVTTEVEATQGQEPRSTDEYYEVSTAPRDERVDPDGADTDDAPTMCVTTSSVPTSTDVGAPVMRTIDSVGPGRCDR